MPQQRVESKADALRRVRSEFDSLSPSILLSEPEAAAVTGFAFNTIKFWRLKVPERGPKPTYMCGRVFYSVGEIRRWRAEEIAKEAVPAPICVKSEVAPKPKNKASHERAAVL